MNVYLIKGMSNQDVLEQVERGYRMPKPVDVELPNSIYEVMLNCWQKNPDKRPTFKYLHSYFGTSEPLYNNVE